jgi:hypothetical protein
MCDLSKERVLMSDSFVFSGDQGTHPRQGLVLQGRTSYYAIITERRMSNQWV